jgi:long-chain acyl-CoA synthetase
MDRADRMDTRAGLDARGEERERAPATSAERSTTPVPFPPADRPWLAHYAAGVPRTIPVPDRSLAPLLDESVRRYGARTAIEYFGASMSYAQLGALVDRFAHALAQLGVGRGDRVALCLPNCPQFPIAFYGALKAGAVVVPTNPIYTGPEMEHQLRDAGVKIAVVIEQALPTLTAVRGQTPVEHVIVTGVDDYFPRALALAYKVKEARDAIGKPRVDMKALRSAPSVSDFKELLGATHDRQGFEVFALPEPAALDDVAVLQYTGGTTGLAKGAMLTHRSLATNAMQAWAWSQLAPGGRHSVLSIAPFFHVFGLTVCMNLSVIHGATMVPLPRFHVSDALKAIEQYKPDLFPGVPAMYMALARAVERKKADLSSIQICISGSAPLPLEVQQQFEAVSGARVVEGYGLTEASPVTHCNPVFGDRRIGTIGLPLPDTDAAIRDPASGEFLPPGEQGELVVRGPQVMAGYWRRPDETTGVLRDGWLLTGDIAVMDANGYFRIVDRAKDMIIVGGLKVFPRQVEDVLFEHPQVQEAAVIGLPAGAKGEIVVAYIIPVPGERPTADELAAFCRERLAPYKVPRRFELRETLPKTIVGKVLRRQLREEALAARSGGQDDEAEE